jgi:hypothetical protein
MKTNAILSGLALIAAAALGACTGDSLQPTASQSAYTPTTGSTGSTTSGGSTAATSYATTRPISDFLKTQGTFCWPDEMGGCKLYLPPVANYVAWYDQDHKTAVSVDYAGLFSAWAGSQGYPSFGTQIGGAVTERPTGDGRAYVTVHLRADNATMFMTDGPNLQDSRLLLGSRPKEMGGSTATTARNAVVGQASFDIRFINPKMGMPLPDLIELIRKPASGAQYIGSDFSFEGDVNYTDASGNVSPSHISIVKTGEITPFYSGTTSMSMTPPMGYISTTVTRR